MAFPNLPDMFLHYLIRCSVLGLIAVTFLFFRSKPKHGWTGCAVWPPFFAVAVAGLCWQAVVTLWVPEPYLDEIFHIPQAQKYCENRWLEWDDKITTPPGLYLISVAAHRFLWLLMGGCSAMTLRMTNWLAIIALPLIAMQCRRLVEARLAEQGSNGQQPRQDAISIYSIHTAMNITFFPLLFFFSGLYYTDLFSSLVVLVAFWNQLERIGTRTSSLQSDILVIILGVSSLFMRQTNVFWVVVFMGGLEAVHGVRSLQPLATTPGQFDYQTTVKFYLWRYSLGEIHDPPLNAVSLDDVFLCALSIAIAVICNPLRVLKQVWAHIVVMALFAGFVLWNGGVVLGDKSNHVATIHLPQMLYIWPLFAFFSAPLLLPLVVEPLLALFEGSAGKGVSSQTSPLSKVLNILGYASLVPVALAIVKFNTIIHPFTLADNRHYMFYIFRYSILRAGWVKYALVPVYILCGIMCLKTLGGSASDTRVGNKPGAREARTVGGKNKKKSHQRPSAPIHHDLAAPSNNSKISPSLSTVILWLLTTTLSLMTAPLVEPRYFILPWVFWRLLTPAWSVPRIPVLGDLGRRYDLRVWVETAWFLLVNAATMYIFITRPFRWPSEEGLQRFMW